MTTLVSLIVVYFFKKYLNKYAFFQNLQQSCSLDWVEDVLYKYQLLANNFPKVPAVAASALLILIISLVLLVIQLIIDSYSYYLGGLIFNISLLFYCFSSINKLNYDSVFVAAFEHVFGMLFWFTILGPIGLVLFWLFTVTASQFNSNVTGMQPEVGGHKDVAVTNVDAGNAIYYSKGVNNCLSTLHTLAAWLPARITGLIFCLIGDFKQGFNCWKEIMRNSSILHSKFLYLCGEASLGNSIEDDAELLIERSFVAWLIFCIIISLILILYMN